MQALWALTHNTQLSNKRSKKWFYSIFSDNIYQDMPLYTKVLRLYSPKKIKIMI